MLIYSMSVSVDGFIADREGAFGWAAPSEELFRFHLEKTRELVGRFEEQGWKLAGAIVPITYIAWSLWLILSGLVLLIG